MKKLLAIIGIIILILVIAIGALFFGIKAYLTPEKVSALLSEKLELSLHHKVELGPVSTGFSSAKVQGFTLLPNNQKDKTAIVTVKEVSLSFSLIPLLKKKLDIRKIIITSPNFYLVREKNGALSWQEEFKKASFNFEEKQRGTGDAGFSFVPTAQAAELQSKGFAVKIGKVEIRDGTIVWVDRSLIPVYKATLTSMSLDLEDFSLNKPFNFHLKGVLNRKKESGIEAKGNLDLARKGLKGNVSLTSVFLPDVSPYLKGNGFKLLDGIGNLDLEFSSRRFKVWEVEQKLTLLSVKIQTQGKTSQPVNASLDIKAKIDLGNNSLSLKDVEGKVMDSDFKLNGDIEKLRTAPRGSLKLVSNKLDLDTLVGLFGIAQKASGKRKAKKAPAANSKKKGLESPSHKAKMQKKSLPALPTLTIQAKIHRLIIRKVKVEEINAKIATSAHEVILDPFSAKMYGGTLQGRIEVDLSSGVPVVRKKVSIKDVNVAPLLSDLKPKMKEKFTGHFFGNAQGEGVMGIPSTYQGDITFHVERGSIQNVGALKVAVAIMKLPSLANLKFDVLKGKALVGNSRVQVVTADAKGEDVSLDVKGTIGFDKKLDLHARLELPYKVVRKGLGKRSNLFADRTDAAKRKWSIIPLRVKGSTDHPLVAVKFEKKAIEKIIEKKIHDKKIKKLLKKLFN